MPTHKKGHDKDKYYFLAKDQGYRSRASYKLIQINKRYDFLSKAKVCIDLCAAPGGWCQVAEKNMASGSIILGVDLLPIRSLRNVKTIVSDITTSECRKMLQSELNGWKADVVLCDGAPNIGSAYAKDAYVQNELVIAALKTATDHLAEGGTFCTKVYRSVDYNAIIWVLQQLFEDVQTMKPNSSRSQSSEIFLVCLKYMAPKSIDPKLLDPNYVFKEVKDPGLKKVDVLHKKYDKSNKRHRVGYDDSLGMLLSSSTTVSDFLASADPVQILTDFNQLVFTQEQCQPYATHEATTPELLICFQDLRVLGKIDFKKILKWRQQMRTEFNIKAGKGPVAAKSEDDETTDIRNADDSTSVVTKISRPVLTEEQEMAEEMDQLHQKKNQKDRKEKKKSRELLSKTRKRLEAGMLNNAFEEAVDMELFSLNQVKQVSGRIGDDGSGSEDGDGGSIGEEEYAMNYIVENEEDADDEDEDVTMAERIADSKRKSNTIIQEDADDSDDDLAAMEEELEYDYKRYVAKKKLKDADEDAKIRASKKYAKKRGVDLKALNAEDDDDEEYNKLEFDSETTSKPQDEEDADGNYAADEFIDQNNQRKKKSKKLKKGRIDSEANAADADGEEEGAGGAKKKKVKSGTTAKKVADTLSLKHTSEWFSNPLFKDTSAVVADSTTTSSSIASSSVVTKTVACKKGKLSAAASFEDDDNDDVVDFTAGADEDDAKIDVPSADNTKKNGIGKKESSLVKPKTKGCTTATTATDSTENGFQMPDMPKTDKQVRKEKRKKQVERSERQQTRRALRDAPDDDDDDDHDNYPNSMMNKKTKPVFNSDGEEIEGSRNSATAPSTSNADDKQYTESDLKRMRLIEKGMGKSVSRDKKGKLMSDNDVHGFEIVPRNDNNATGDDSMKAYYNNGNNDGDEDGEEAEASRKKKREADDDEEDDIMTREYLLNGQRNKLLHNDNSSNKPTAENRVMSLALGTLMLNHARKKALIDSSYNRYSWNDSADDLPAWFAEDEMRHNKPQIPVPAALLEQIKGRFKMTGTKEIKKVAEARARKRKRTLQKLNSAKKKANAMAESTDMSQREKMKAINRAMREAKINKPGKVYVITRQTGGGGSSGTKSDNSKGKLKFVDKRLKKDKRADRANKKRAKK